MEVRHCSLLLLSSRGRTSLFAIVSVHGVCDPIVEIRYRRVDAQARTRLIFATEDERRHTDLGVDVPRIATHQRSAAVALCTRKELELPVRHATCRDAYMWFHYNWKT